MDDYEYNGVFDHDSIKNGLSIIPEEYADFFDRIENDATIPPERIILIVTLIVCILGLVGNALVCYVIVANKNMRTSTNMYLLSLAVSDMLLLLSFASGAVYSVKLSREYSSTTLKVMFNVMRYIFYTANLTSTLITLAITVDRYLAVCYPFSEMKTSSKSKALKVTLIMWLVSVIYIIIYECVDIVCKHLAKLHCHVVKILISTEVNFLIFYFIPMILNVILYTLIVNHIWNSSQFRKNSSNIKKNKTRGKLFPKEFNMSVSVVVEFMICWGPMQIVTLLNKYHYLDNIQSTKEALAIISLTLYIFSTVINPIMYSVMSTKFRRAFKSLLFTSRLKVSSSL